MNDNIPPATKGLGVRLCYLLSNRLRFVGDFNEVMDFEENLKGMNLDGKLRFLLSKEEELPEESIDLIKSYKQALKAARKTRITDKALLVLHKKAEIGLNQIYKIVVDVFMRPIKKSGVLELKEIFNKPDFSMYHVNCMHPEKEDMQFTVLSKVFLLNLNEDDVKFPSFFFVSNHFFTPEFTDIYKEQIPTLNQFTPNGFLLEMFTLPNFNDFTIADIDAISIKIQAELQNFQEAANHFASLVLNPEQAFQYLQNTVSPAADTTQKAITNTFVFKTYYKNRLDDTPFVKMYLGILPQQLLLNYFEKTEIITQPTLDVLSQHPIEDKLVPVIVMKFLTKESTEDQQPSLALKKSLSID